jgi:hypothetical protein
MEKTIKKVNSPEELNDGWDKLADSYYLSREFLIYLHRNNYCSQQYYELFSNGGLIAGTIVYTIKANILTFLNIPSPVKFKVIGLPVSIASPPFVGDPGEVEYLLSEILKAEKGIILGLNFKEDYLQNKVLNIRTLPTILLTIHTDNMEGYENSLRHPYRRRMHRNREKFAGVTSVDSSCAVFDREHHDLYLQVMKKTTTKLEILQADFFRYLPSNFELTTYYASGKMLFWYILCRDKLILYYFMCGINYTHFERFHLYQNSLLDIVSVAMKYKYQTIDLGQTAEIAKMRLGGIPDERRMFIYHRNPLVFGMLRLFGHFLAYSKINGQLKVFKYIAPVGNDGSDIDNSKTSDL